MSGRWRKLGIQLIDCGSVGDWAKQDIPLSPEYQACILSLFHAKLQASSSPKGTIRRGTQEGIVVGAVDLIAQPKDSEDYLQAGKADVIFLAGELMRNPSWARMP